MAKPDARKEREDQKAQVAGFRKAARELGADKSSEADFQDALRKVAKAKPSEKRENK